MGAVAQAAPGWVRESRDIAAKRCAEVGFPNTKLEDWRFTNVAPVAEARFPLAEGSFVSPI